jgi:hypothetical protein
VEVVEEAELLEYPVTADMVAAVEVVAHGPE